MFRSRTILAAILFAALAAGNTFAGTMIFAGAKGEPQRLRWKGNVIRIGLSLSMTDPEFNIKSDSDVLTAVKKSLAAWERVTDVRFQLETTDRTNVSASGPAGDGVSLITIAPSTENVLLFAKDPDAQSAKTRVFYSGRGFITEADIVLNPYQQFSTDGTFGTFDIQATLTHEIGHLLGLKHSGVLGSTMAASVAPNGTFGAPDISSRVLSQSDIAAVRDLYGIPADSDEACCGQITGKIVGPPSKLSRSVRVWAEETGTGRVIAETEAAADGTYRFGGLPLSEYSVYWQWMDENGAQGSGSVGSADLKSEGSKVLNSKLEIHSNDVTMGFIGTNGHLADTAISITRGREYTILLGGHNLTPATADISFNSPFITVAPYTSRSEDFGPGAEVVSLVVNISEKAQPGVYSITAAGRDGRRSILIGSLRVE